MSLNNIDSILDSTAESLAPKENKLDYYNLSHRGMSYSRSLTLHACPRKFELDAKYNIKKRRNSVTFAYGHAVGEGIQSVLSGDSTTLALTKTIMAYDFDEEDMGNDSEKAAKKSIWWAVVAIELFSKQYHAGVYGFLDGWEVPTFEVNGTSRKAAELSFVIDCTNGYTFEGHIDLVLHHPVANKYMILELKTTGMTSVSEASYKNSSQALGYGIVVDQIASNMKASASFDVLYMVFKSRSMEIVPMLFNKTPTMRAQWLTGLISDIQSIEQYEEQGYYPHRGESCYNYFRECEYMANECHMKDSLLERSYGKVVAKEEGDQFDKMEEPDFLFHINDIAQRQAELIELGAASADNGVNADMLLDITSAV